MNFINVLSDLNEQQSALANYMSNLSEEAYSASWMEGLEFALWQAIQGRLDVYGRLTLNAEIIKNLIKLSNEAIGWIYFDDMEEEKYVTFEEWNQILKNNDFNFYS